MTNAPSAVIGAEFGSTSFSSAASVGKSNTGRCDGVLPAIPYIKYKIQGASVRRGPRVRRGRHLDVAAKCRASLARPLGEPISWKRVAATKPFNAPAAASLR